jgi:hypothetical protein
MPFHLSVVAHQLYKLSLRALVKGLNQSPRHAAPSHITIFVSFHLPKVVCKRDEKINILQVSCGNFARCLWKLYACFCGRYLESAAARRSDVARDIDRPQIVIVPKS